ncbi:PTS system mannose/fructose/N-acetylgalactosamine-transporter subunit IIB [Sporolactobacillus terrae]|uniref:PTS mannose/fructose/sorbose transporter subunit IIB n=1 Tax=Sporolactobacillus terrae TaxID=269673 RepID=A0ABX5Q563_9BACL|nr:PTS sugar transporter subunit IIB [Sporolactobacillus terrae]QAA21765.1 PTS mannose/fructose/sorbose transporter subunit IIB [Sporolactobacillus terrae]QAA24738.1 PTS mannose/fructose/sorbose transporter subunit IIB [Sporolactobacillus terrae]UAK16567.1 PTS sugar transporter subunit IIB [Sporolactobacillus terrae]
MIVALRVDERLIHGQIAMTWSKELKIKGIVVPNDEAAGNEMQKMALKMAVPSGIKVLIKPVDDAIKVLNNPKAANMRMLVIVKTIKDAVRVVEKVPNIEYVNIGNVGKAVNGKKTELSSFVLLTDEELENLKKLVELEPKTALQVVPSAEKKLAKDLLASVKK